VAERQTDQEAELVDYCSNQSTGCNEAGCKVFEYCVRMQCGNPRFNNIESAYNSLPLSKSADEQD
jgi:hypothetical protein